MTKPLVLVVDDEPDICELLAITLRRMAITSHIAKDLNGARDLLKQHTYQLCLTDMRLPDGDGLQLVAEIQYKYPGTPVAIITAHGCMDTAIQALKSGAFDFLTKPVNLESLRSLIDSAIKTTAMSGSGGPVLVGESESIRQMRATITKLARSQAPVYISGESGTGKELVARMIHEQGPRSAKAFVAVNCGAIPSDLMESEFFGHKKGSFTGAHSDKQGLFQAANGGTLFLDEVGELPLAMQVKLLRAIQEKAVRPVGAQSEEKVDVRILSATHKDLNALVAGGQFRQDLFYRINVIQLSVPPLRDRTGDIPLLVDFFLTRMANAAKHSKPELSETALQALVSYSFPGNVRELENILERALTLAEGREIGLNELQLPAIAAQADESSPTALPSYLSTVEKERIMAALEQSRWNKTAAARLLGISFRALRYRLEKLNMN